MRISPNHPRSRSESPAAVRRLHAGPDGTCSRELRRLLEAGRFAVTNGCRAVEIDLSRVRRMNCALLATVVLLAREARAAGAQLTLRRMSDAFTHWAEICGVLPILHAVNALPELADNSSGVNV